MKNGGHNRSGFGFLKIPVAPRKPRTRRWTILSDRGIPLEIQEGLLVMIGDIVDRVKWVDHAGLIERLPARLIAQKNAVYRKHGIGVFPGGVPFEVAYLQRKAGRFLERLPELEFTGVEISADCIPPIPGARRARLIKRARALGLEVFTEIGYKVVGERYGRASLRVKEAVDGIRRDLDAGASKVTVESNELNQYLRKKNFRAPAAIVEAIGLEHILFEIGSGGKLNVDLAVWLLEQFGPDINVENIEADSIIHFEAMRRGLSRAGDFAFFAGA